MAAPEPALSTPPRDSQLDALRGLAMLGVVAIHVAARMPESWRPASQWIDHAGRFGVPLFIGAAGVMAHRQLVVAPQPSPAADWLLRRGHAVVLPYLLWGLVYAAMGAAPMAGDWSWGEPLATRLIAVALGYSAEHLWYMPAYLGLVLLTPAAAAAARWLVRRRHGWPMLRALLAALAVGQLALLWALERVVAGGRTPPDWADVLLQAEGRIPLQWIGFWAAGWLLATVRPRPAWTAPRWSWLRVGGGLLLHAWLVQRQPRSLAFDDFWCSPAIAGVTVALLSWAPPLLAMLDRRARAPMAALRRLGSESLPVYLSHVGGLVVAAGWWGADARFADPLTLAAGLAWTAAWVLAYRPLHRRWLSGSRGLPHTARFR